MLWIKNVSTSLFSSNKAPGFFPGARRTERNYITYVSLPILLNLRVGGLIYKYSKIKYLQFSLKL